MEQELKNKWIKALRSGKYLQGKNSLKQKKNNQDKFCCLGVLCDLVDNKKWEDSDENSYCSYSYCTMFLPLEIIKSQKITADIEKKLAKMNDDGSTFDEIADFIEGNL